MELLLNILWLTLALPAIWLWQHESARVRRSRFHSRFHASLLLICVLMLLFPVVSATDDLHPMRTEMEECNPFKRVVKQSSVCSSVAGFSTSHSFFAASVSYSRICLSNDVGVLVSPGWVVFPETVALGRRDSRAPPSFLLG